MSARLAFIKNGVTWLEQVFGLRPDEQPDNVCLDTVQPVVDVTQASWPRVIHALKDVQNFAPGGFTIIGPLLEVTVPNLQRPLFQTPGPGWTSILTEVTINAVPAAVDAGVLFSLRAGPNADVPAPAMSLRALGFPVGAARTYLSQGGQDAALVSAGTSDTAALLFRPMTIVPFGWSLALALVGAGAVGSAQFYVQHLPPGLSYPY